MKWSSKLSIKRITWKSFSSLQWTIRGAKNEGEREKEERVAEIEINGSISEWFDYIAEEANFNHNFSSSTISSRSHA